MVMMWVLKFFWVFLDICILWFMDWFFGVGVLFFVKGVFCVMFDFVVVFIVLIILFIYVNYCFICLLLIIGVMVMVLVFLLIV